MTTKTTTKRTVIITKEETAIIVTNKIDAQIQIQIQIIEIEIEIEIKTNNNKQEDLEKAYYSTGKYYLRQTSLYMLSNLKCITFDADYL